MVECLVDGSNCVSPTCIVHYCRSCDRVHGISNCCRGLAIVPVVK